MVVDVIDNLGVRKFTQPFYFGRDTITLCLCELHGTNVIKFCMFAQNKSHMELNEIKALTKWIPTWHDVGGSMDLRHILMLKELILAANVKTAIEVGVLNGCSSSAFVEAGIGKQTAFIDLGFNEKARKVLNGLNMVQMDSVKYLESIEELPDLIFLDGAHDIDTVQNEWLAIDDKLADKPFILVLHDVSGLHGCDGPKGLFEHLYWSNRKDRTIVDWVKRENEATDRGLSIHFFNYLYFQAVPVLKHLRTFL